MIEDSGLAFTLHNTKEGLTDTENMDCRRLLPERHAEKLLIELRRAMKIGNPHSDMVQTDRVKAGWLLLSSNR